MKKYMIWNTRPFHPPTRKWALAPYEEPAIRTRVKIKAWLSRITGIFNDDFKRWAKDLAPIVIFIVVLIVPFLPKPVFYAICNVILLLVAFCLFLPGLAMPFLCGAVFVYFVIANHKNSQKSSV